MEGGPVSRPCSPEAACERAFYPETMVRKVVDFHDAGTALLGGLTNIGAFCASSRCVKMKRIANDLHQDPATARHTLAWERAFPAMNAQLVDC
ncbi:hypothetical protein CC207_01720 [Pseudomonas sp. DrBHI1]|nr:hypothetical protein CC207_01720 [Pseudomonas sp. DrBHI1]